MPVCTIAVLILFIGGWVIAYLVMLACGATLPPIFPHKIGWWYFPATLIGSWVVVSAGMSLGLTGQRWLFMELFCVLLGLFFVGINVTEYVLTKEQRQLFALGLTASFGVLFVLLTVWAMLKALRRSLISLSTAWLATAAWAIPSTTVVLVGVLNPTAPLAVHILVVGILALAVAPLATAPLALEWNRTR